MHQGAGDPAGGGDRSENADIRLGEFELVGHEVIERRAEPGSEGIEKQEQGDEVQFRGPAAPRRCCERCAAFPAGLPWLFLSLSRNTRRKDHGYGSNCRHGGGGLQGRKGRQTLNQLAAGKRARHDGDVEPQPLLADERAAETEALTVLRQQGAAQGACRGHRERGEDEQQRELAGRAQPGDPAIGADRADTRDDQIALSTVAKQRNEIGDEPEDRLDDPREIEDGEIGGDLDRRPADILQVKIERLEDDADARLADAFDDIDDGEEQHEPTDVAMFFCRSRERGTDDGLPPSLRGLGTPRSLVRRRCVA